MSAPQADRETFYVPQPPLSPRVRALAAVGWSAFLGAVVATPVYLYASAMPGQGLGQLSVVFLAAWAAAVVPAGMSWLLSGRAPRRAPLHRSEEFTDT